MLYAYDEAGHLLGEYDGTGTLIEETVWLGDIPVATLKPSGSSVSVFYIHSDGLNTPRQVTRPNDNTVMWTCNSDPFGTDAANANPSGAGTFAYNLRFPGQLFDGQAGLHQNYFRDFDPASGRYAQSDLIGLAGGNYSTYSYTYESPVDMGDVSGLVTAVVVNNNTPVIGSHAGLYTSNSIYDGSMIYDPSGSYQNDTRGEGGFFTPGDILDYIHFQMGDGIDVQTLIFNTTPAEEREISQRVDNYGDPRGFKCADSVARVLDGIGPFKGLGKLLSLNSRRFVVTPRELLSALKTLQESKN